MIAAQDDWDLLVRVCPLDLEALEDSALACVHALPTDGVTPASTAGLIVALAEKLP